MRIGGDKRHVFGQGRPMAKDAVGAATRGATLRAAAGRRVLARGGVANRYQGTLSAAQNANQNIVESRLFFTGTTGMSGGLDLSRATDAREKGRLGFFGAAESYAGAYPRVTSEPLGRDLNPLGRGDGQAYVAGALSLKRIAPRLPKALGLGGYGNSVNNGCKRGCWGDFVPGPPPNACWAAMNDWCGVMNLCRCFTADCEQAVGGKVTNLASSWLTPMPDYDHCYWYDRDPAAWIGTWWEMCQHSCAGFYASGGLYGSCGCYNECTDCCDDLAVVTNAAMAACCREGPGTCVGGWSGDACRLPEGADGGGGAVPAGGAAGIGAGAGGGIPARGTLSGGTCALQPASSAPTPPPQWFGKTLGRAESCCWHYYNTMLNRGLLNAWRQRKVACMCKVVGDPSRFQFGGCCPAFAERWSCCNPDVNAISCKIGPTILICNFYPPILSYYSTPKGGPDDDCQAAHNLLHEAFHKCTTPLASDKIGGPGVGNMADQWAHVIMACCGCMTRQGVVFP